MRRAVKTMPSLSLNCRYLQHSQSKSGFGLVEFLISTTLLTIFLLGGCYLLLNLFSIKQLDSTVAKLVNSFQLAQQNAIDSNSVVAVEPIDNSWQRGWRVVSISNEATKTGPMVIYEQPLSHQQLLFKHDNALAIAFRPNGMTTRLSPLGSQGLLLCNANGQGRKIMMMASGAVQVKTVKQECGTS